MGTQSSQPQEEKSNLNHVDSPTSSPITPSSPCHHCRRKSPVLIVTNGITGNYVSSRICKIAANFYHQNIDTLSVYERLEVGCSVFFNMNTHPEIQEIVKFNITTKNKSIEVTALKVLDMIGWLLRNLITSNIDLYALLTRLGGLHQRMGIEIYHFIPMLTAMHQTFSQYFPSKYTLEVRYSFDEIITLAAQIMTLPAKSPRYLTHISRKMKGDVMASLEDVSVCVNSQIGKDFFYKYLAQNACDEIAIFLKSVYNFKRLETDQERYNATQNIYRLSIEPTAKFCLNMSHETRQNITKQIQELEQLHSKINQKITMRNNLFAQVEIEIYEWIMEYHWSQFVNAMGFDESKHY
eukprot:122085_1